MEPCGGERGGERERDERGEAEEKGSGRERGAHGGVISRLIDAVYNDRILSHRANAPRARARAPHSQNVMHVYIRIYLPFFSHGCFLAEPTKRASAHAARVRT